MVSQKGPLRHCGVSTIFLGIRSLVGLLTSASCLWAFLLCRPLDDFLRDHRVYLSEYSMV